MAYEATSELSRPSRRVMLQKQLLVDLSGNCREPDLTAM